MITENALQPRPWYREPWPWILIAGPAAVVVAGIVTIWIAFSGADGLVAEDYYKQGLAINRVLEREAAARRLGIVAQVEPGGGRLRLRLSAAERLRPPALFVQLAHATRAGYDARLRLAPTGEGVYEGELPALAKGRWRISIEDPQATWRVAGIWSGAMQPFRLGAAGDAPTQEGGRR